MGGSEKKGVPYFGVLIVRILLFGVLHKGPLFSETPHTCAWRSIADKASAARPTSFISFRFLDFDLLCGFLLYELSIVCMLGDRGKIVAKGLRLRV